ncbi:MAG: cytochrome C [Geobacteraceae bacterium]|nr:cytochrome C [Geobacteraceae bacterium]
MKNCLFPLLSILLLLCSGCTMFHTWKTIPPPGGCDQCHTVAISNNWRVVYQAPILTDERAKLSFQTEQGTMPQAAKPDSALELRKVEEQPCFDCHKAPNSKHRERKGRYHH